MESMGAEFPSPLKGIKVLDLTHVQSGPTCTVMLADMGAEVIKVEPFDGDQFRTLREGCDFSNYNRGKRALALNLKADAGKKIALQLAKQADVFIENFVPGAVDRLGLGYEALSKLNPGIVYCSISGFGQDGPLRDRPAYDPCLQAMSGIMDCTGEPDRPPARIRPAMIDFCTGVNAAFTIASCLFGREKTGRGQKIDLALLDVAVYAMCSYVTQYKLTGALPGRAGSAQPDSALVQTFETRDGLLYIVAGRDEMWRNLCKVLGRDDLAGDPTLAERKQRNERRLEIAEIINAETRKHPCRELEAKLLAAGVACAKVANIGEIAEEPHVLRRGVLEEANHPTMGRIVTLKTPVLIGGKPAPFKRPAPLIGEHTREILRELGYRDEEITALIKEGVALQSEPARTSL
jgi:crotonobetainyl-CoA:carnitine CoA-transferase CaiB-like acyl-CoA transferase